MITPRTIKDLNKAFESSPDGFVVVDSGKPRFAVLDYKAYRSLKKKKSEGNRGSILVTGGAGYIGSHTVRLLEKKGCKVIVYDNLSTGRKEAVRGSKLVVADLADMAALDKVMTEEKIDAVIHFAASLEVEESIINPAKYFKNNVINGLNLLGAMVEHGVSKIVFSSTAAVYGEAKSLPISELNPCMPESPYGESKLWFEKILKWYRDSYGIHSVSLRYFNAAGAWPEEDLGYYNANGSQTHLVPRVLEVAAGKNSEIEVYGQDYPTPDGSCIRDYIHVLDLAQAHISALEKLENSNGAYVYNVGTGKGHSVLEVIEKAMEITGRMIPMKIRPRRSGDPAALVADSSRLEQELGFSPTRNLEQILESAWKWHTLRSTN